MKPKVYLDNNATTFIDPRALAAVSTHLQTHLGNPSSLHAFGQEARAILTNSRHYIAASLGVKSQEIIFTSGGTESLNMIFRGIFQKDGSSHLITSSVEHAAVYSTAKALEALGTNVTFLNPGIWGAVEPQAVKAAIRPNTQLIALMAVNNETGVKTDIKAIGAIAKEAKIPFLVDGIALLGKEPFQIPDGVTAMVFSGHKLHAPKGIGLTWVRNTLSLLPLLTGGEQEFGKRGGTENLPGIVGLAKAIALLEEELPKATIKMANLRNKFEAELIDALPGVTINGTGPRICNTSNLAFEGIEGETLLMRLDMEGIAASHGSACASGALEPSRILLNMGYKREHVASSLRFSLSRMTSEQEIETAVHIICTLVRKLRHQD